MTDSRGNAPGSDLTSSTRRVAERLFDAASAGAAPETIAELFDEHVDWDIPGDTASVPWIGRRSDRAGAAAFYRQHRELVSTVRFEIRKLLVEGDTAVVLGEFESRVISTGKVMQSEFAFVLIVRDGLIVRLRMLEDSFAVARAAN